MNRIGPTSPQPWVNDNVRTGAPIRFYHQGRSAEDAYTLYAPDQVNRKAWHDTIQKRREIKFRRKPVFGIADSAKRYEFFADIKAHHMVLFGTYKLVVVACSIRYLFLFSLLR